MTAKLPGWAVDDVTSVHAEVAEWAHLSPADRWKLAEPCVRDAMDAARASGDPKRILEHVDPLLASTVAARRRLMKEAEWGNGAR